MDAADGTLDMADVVRLLRFALGSYAPTADELIRGDLAPAETVETGPPETLRPTLAQPMTIDVGDVVVALRAAVGQIRLAHPR